MCYTCVVCCVGYNNQAVKDAVKKEENLVGGAGCGCGCGCGWMVVGVIVVVGTQMGVFNEWDELCKDLGVSVCVHMCVLQCAPSLAPHRTP